MFDLITTPYPLNEAVGMIRRRFSPPPPRPPHSSFRRLEIDPQRAPDEWIGFVGDISPPQGRHIEFDEEVQDFFGNCTYIVGNLEGVITDRPWFPCLHNHTLEVFDVLSDLKPLPQWVLSVANNHALDYGPRALRRTVIECARRGITCVGTDEYPRVTVAGGVTLTSWTWWVNRKGRGVARQDPGCLPEEGLHVAYPHWGYEHEREPRTSQRLNVPDRYDAVIGHHSHLPQPVELIDGQRPVAWSLGNFITVKQLPVLGEGVILKVGLTRSRGEASVSEVQALDIEIERPLRTRRCAVVPRCQPLI